MSVKSEGSGLYDIIGSNLKENRKENGYTQKEFAKIFGISYSTLAHYEEGINRIPLELLIQIADYYDVPMDRIIGRKDYSNVKHKKTVSGFDVDKFIEKVLNLSVGSQKALEELLKHLK